MRHASIVILINFTWPSSTVLLQFFFAVIAGWGGKLILDGFTVSTRILIDTLVGGGADGMTIAFQSNNNSAVGAFGGMLGFGGMAKAIGVRLDSHVQVYLRS